MNNEQLRKAIDEIRENGCAVRLNDMTFEYGDENNPSKLNPLDEILKLLPMPAPAPEFNKGDWVVNGNGVLVHVTGKGNQHNWQFAGVNIVGVYSKCWRWAEFKLHTLTPDDLPKCPYCGEDKLACNETVKSHFDERVGRHHVGCYSCHINLPYFDTIKKAVESALLASIGKALLEAEVGK